jgi:uncharacterized UBP type Zn finger protein
MTAWKKIKKEICPHYGSMKVTTSEQKSCEVCGEKNDLRLCTSCGRVFCCESHQAHNTAHFKETGHPIIKPIHTDYDFTWCYACKAYLE